MLEYLWIALVGAHTPSLPPQWPRLHKEYGHHWMFDIEHFPSRAIFVCGREGLLKVVPLRGKNISSLRNQAHTVEGQLTVEYDKTKAAARRRLKVDAAEKAACRSNRRICELTERIAETPAEGITGVCIKLAAAIKHEKDFMQEPAVSLVASAYELSLALSTPYIRQPAGSLFYRGATRPNSFGHAGASRDGARA
jgi:hypothetical protein